MSRFARIACLSVALAAICGSAHAQVRLIAVGGLEATGRDRSVVTGGGMENGVAGNLFGGIGSGLAYAGGNVYLALPDRGPNAVAYNGFVSDTATYIPRFHTLTLDLLPAPAGSPLPYRLRPALVGTTLLHAAQPLVYGDGRDAGLPSGEPELNRLHRTHYFTGRADAFDARTPSTSSRDGRLDPEGIRVSPNGVHAYVTDEYGPYVYRFDRRTGRRNKVYSLPAAYAVAFKSGNGDEEIAANLQGRVANKGMEGLALSPDGRTLFGVMQSPLLQDGGVAAPFTRIVAIDVETGATREYAYPLTNIGTAAKPKYPTVSEIVAINDHSLLLDERDGKGLGDNSQAAFKRLYRVDLASAPTIDGLYGREALAARSLSKALFLDVVQALTAQGIAPADIPAKLEGVAFGPDVRLEGRLQHTLIVANDNDFLPTITDTLHPAGIPNPNRFFVFAFGAGDLPGYVPQRFLGNR